MDKELRKYLLIVAKFSTDVKVSEASLQAAMTLAILELAHAIEGVGVSIEVAISQLSQAVDRIG